MPVVEQPKPRVCPICQATDIRATRNARLYRCLSCGARWTMGTREHDKPLNPSDPSQEHSDRNRAIKDEFDTAHQDGMAALKSGDLDALDDAIKREKSEINKHTALARSLKPKRR